MSRLKALYRSWAIPCGGRDVYYARHRAEWLGKIQHLGVRRRAEHLYQHLSTFTIHFPASGASVDTMKSLPALRPTVAAVETILLVEDEHGLRKLMKEFLVAEGYTVLESADGPSAIEISKRYRGAIHLLLTDVIMPKMHGRNLTMQLRQQRPGLKVLYITGHDDPGTMKGARVLEKPFLPEMLLREIRGALSTPDISITARTG
jgi:CheY-like chemotaxis protein